MDSIRSSFAILLLIIAVSAGDKKTLKKDIKYRVLSDETLSSIDGFYNVHTTFDKFGRHKRQSETNNVTNITKIQDHHRYYISRYIIPGKEADDLWFELGDLIGSGAEIQTNVTESIIQGLHRYFEVWNLKFDFPFYGHIIDLVAVTTGGFLYTSDFLHDQVHLTQFIAPLQADFNPSLHDTAKIFVYSTVERFTVQWDLVHNHDHVDDGPFTFQVSLFPNGTIIFVYREIPLPVSQLNNDDHPVEVGLADAFYFDVIERFFFVRYIVEYSRIQLNASNDLAYSAYVITPVPNCVIASSCDQCTAITEEGNFDCAWCPDIERCSDGLDRHTQEWIISGCEEDAIDNCNPPHASVSSTLTTSLFSTSTVSSVHTTSLFSTSTVSSVHTTSLFSTSTVSSVHTTSLFASAVLSTHTTVSSTHTTVSATRTISLSTSPTLPTLVTPVVDNRTSLSSGVVTGIGITILLIVTVLIAVFIVIGILIYGYKRPTSRLGLFMIEHRPKAWFLNNSKTYEVKGEKVLLEDEL